MSAHKRADLIVPYVIWIKSLRADASEMAQASGPKFSKPKLSKPEFYVHQVAKPRTDASSMVSQTLPMAAMFMRNKIMSWSSVFLALQSYLTEPANKPASEDGGQPPLLRLAFAFVSLATCYLEYFFPATSPTLRRAASAASESAASVVSSATASASV